MSGPTPAVETVREALGRLDSGGHLDATDVPPLRSVSPELRAYARSVDHPRALFGDWAELPSEARSAFRDLVGDDLLGSAALYPRGAVWTGAVRACREADRWLTGRRRSRLLRQLAIRGTVRLHDGPLALWRKTRARSGRRRWVGGRRPTVADLVHGLELDPRWLLGDFVRGVPLPPEAPGYWDDTRRNVVHGFHIGLDLLPTPSGVYCIEANLRTGLKKNRYGLAVGNPIPREAVELARAHGARRLVWVELQGLPLMDRVVGELREAARQARLRLDILEDPTLRTQGARSPDAYDIGAYRRLDRLQNDTLVLSRRERRWGADFLLNQKDNATRVLEAWLAKTGDTRFRVLPMSSEPRLPDESPTGLPNLVYKYPDSGAAKGVFFMRARDAPHAEEMARELDRARGEPPGVFQPFVAGHLADDRRVFDVRVELFLTPRQVRFATAVRRVSGERSPERLDWGLVENTALFASNVMRGGRLGMPGDEEEAVVEAALAVGEAFRQELNRTFRIGPER